MSAASSGAVPGDVARVRQLADELRTMAVGLREAMALATGVSVAGWTGPAAAAFSRLAGIDPAPYARAAGAIGAAGDVVLSHVPRRCCTWRARGCGAAGSRRRPPCERRPQPHRTGPASWSGS